MACRLFGPEPLSKPMLGYSQIDPYEWMSVNITQNIKLFIPENASENIVCEMAAILSGGDELRESEIRAGIRNHITWSPVGGINIVTDMP